MTEETLTLGGQTLPLLDAFTSAGIRDGDIVTLGSRVFLMRDIGLMEVRGSRKERRKAKAALRSKANNG